MLQSLEPRPKVPRGPKQGRITRSYGGFWNAYFQTDVFGGEMCTMTSKKSVIIFSVLFNNNHITIYFIGHAQ